MCRLDVKKKTKEKKEEKLLRRRSVLTAGAPMPLVCGAKCTDLHNRESANLPSLRCESSPVTFAE